MLSVGFRTFEGTGCPVAEGCSVIFDANSSVQYFPSNTTHYHILLRGELNLKYSDGSAQTIDSIYSSNNWTAYQDIWRYGVGFDGKIQQNSTFAVLSLLNNSATSSECTLQVKTIENETFSFNTDKLSVLFVCGFDHQYNGNTVNANGKFKISGYRNLSGNTTTHEIVATTPITLVLLEKE